MENATEALIMSGQILIFLIALTVCISSFTTVRAEVNRIVGENDEIRLSKQDGEYINYMKSEQNQATRIVEADTVMTSMYRAIKENYVIYIKTDYSGIESSDIVKTIKATKEIKNAKNETIINIDDILIKVTIGNDTNQYVNKVLKEELFDKIKGQSFYEYLGEYQNEAAGVASVNKDTYRIITYVQIT